MLRISKPAENQHVRTGAHRRHKNTGKEQHWVGRSCKIYTKVNERWFFIHQTGLLEYTQ